MLISTSRLVMAMRRKAYRNAPPTEQPVRRSTWRALRVDQGNQSAAAALAAVWVQN